MMKTQLALLIGLTGLLGISSSYANETSEARMRDMLKQATVQLRTVQDENASLKIQLDTLKAQLNQKTVSKPAEVQPASDKNEVLLKKKMSQQQQTINHLNAQLTQARQQYGDYRSTLEKLSQLKRGFSQVQAQKDVLNNQLLASQNNTAQLQLQVNTLNKQLSESEQNNLELVKISKELLTRYKEKGVFSALANQEPLTGLYRVKLENLAQEYESKIQDQTLLQNRKMTSTSGITDNTQTDYGEATQQSSSTQIKQ